MAFNDMNNNENVLKLPPISMININHNQIEEPHSWKSPPYPTEPNRDIPLNNITLPIMQQNKPPLNPNDLTPSLKIEQDMDKVVKQCHILSDTILIHKNELLSINNQNTMLDDMIRNANEVLNVLLRLRKHQLFTLIEKEQEQSNYQQQQQQSHHQQSHYTSNVEPLNNTSTTQGPYATHSNTISYNTNPTTRPRKKGKRPPFQGRCHSCNISETPEWRRGPDGARTLCNACGLHYAKMARKQLSQQNK